MPDAVSAELAPYTKGVRSLPNAVTMALVTQAVLHEISANYLRLLEELVFPHKPAFDEKQILSLKRTLVDSEANTVLTIVWKESPYVTDAELALSGYSRSFGNVPLTSHSLAVSLATTPKDVAATNSRVRQIVLAASAYNLIKRDQACGNKVSLGATEFLHGFMVKLGEANGRAYERLLLTRRLHAVVDASSGAQA